MLGFRVPVFGFGTASGVALGVPLKGIYRGSFKGIPKGSLGFRVWGFGFGTSDSGFRRASGPGSLGLHISWGIVYGWLSKMMVPFWVLIIIRHLIFRVPKKGA